MELNKAEIIQKIKEKWIAEFGDLNRNIDSEPPNGYFVAGFVSSVLDEFETSTPAHSGDELPYDAYFDLFKFFSDEHGLVLLDSELSEIIYRVNKFQGKNHNKEIK